MTKNIVICFDGTGNDFDGPSSNVLKTYRSIIKDPTKDQIAFYDPGVGTTSTNTAYNILLNKLINLRKKILGGAFGLGVKHNIGDAYHYLMNCYDEDDKVFIFGFSRGAFTARAFAGMLNKCGLLDKRCDNLIPYAEKINFAKNNKEEAETFKRSVSRLCTPHLIGVWDTVGSLGKLMKKRTFFDTELNPDIKVGLHAVSIDEKRKKFPVTLWAKCKNPHQTIEQVWFPGVHSDVGGGYPESGLSDCALEWMLSNAEKHGLKLHDEYGYDIVPNYIEDMHESLKWYWKILGARTRKIQPYTNIDSSESEKVKIHKSVFDRMGRKSADIYKPELPNIDTIEMFG